MKIDRENTIIKVELIDSVGCKAIDDFVIEAGEGELIFPNAIIVGDANNSVFKPYGINSCVNVKVFQIFNRWGEKVFSCSDNNCATIGWDTKYNKNEVKPGIFLYVFVYKDINRVEKVVKGSFVVLK